MTSKITIATAQTVIHNEVEHAFDGTSPPFPAIEANLTVMAAKIAAAASEGAEVVVFPEFCVQGIAREQWYLAWLDTAIFEHLGALARQHRIAIVGSVLTGIVPAELQLPAVPSVSPFEHLLTGPVAGSGVTRAQKDWAAWVSDYKAVIATDFRPVVKNTAFFIDETGELTGRYDKRNLWHPERQHVTPGDSFCRAFDTKWGKAGLLICWDISHSSAAQALSDQGVDLVFVSAYWLATDPEPQLSRHEHDPEYEKKLVQSWMFGRAVETESVWVLSNAVGKAEDGYMGGSGVWAPLRGKMAGFAGPEEGLVFAEVDLPNVLKDAKEAYKIREDYAKCKR